MLDKSIMNKPTFISIKASLIYSFMYFRLDWSELNINRITLQAVFKRENGLLVKGAMYIGKLTLGGLVFLHFRFVWIDCFGAYHISGNAWLYLFLPYAYIGIWVKFFFMNILVFIFLPYLVIVKNKEENFIWCVPIWLVSWW